MQLETRKYLFDMRQAAERIARFCDGKSFDEYRGDELLRSAVERQWNSCPMPELCRARVESVIHVPLNSTRSRLRQGSSRIW